MIGIAAVIALSWLVLSRWDLPVIIVVGVAALFGYRRIRNRPRRLLNRFITKVGKMPEVRMITRDDRQVTVIVDEAAAKTYVRINAWMDKINEKRFFGEPFTVSVRDELSADELRSLLQGPGVRYVRDDVVGQSD